MARPRTGVQHAGRILVLLAGLYLLLGLAAFLLQRRLIYHPERLEGPATSPSPTLELVQFPSRDGVRLTGLFARPTSERAPVVLVLHGNAGSLRTWRTALEEWVELGAGGLLLDPRGYGWSEGAPSEAGWHADGRAALDWLMSRGVATERVVLHGISIGSGIAVPLAAERGVRGLVLESALTSLVDTAARQFPFLPVSLLLQDRYDNVSAAAGVRCPVLLLHGEDDRLTPAEEACRLAAAFAPTPDLHIVPRRGHNDLPAWPERHAVLRRFLERLR